MRMNPLYAIWWFLLRVFCIGICGAKATGLENMPKEGPFILASNHVSYADPPILGSMIHRGAGFMAKRELFSFKPLGFLLRRVHCIPVRRGAVDRETIRLCVKELTRGWGVAMFPEGTRGTGEQFLDPKPGIGMIAKRCPCPVVPAYITNSNKLKDCILRRKKMSIVYGAPIPAEWIEQVESGREGYYRIAREVMDRISALKEAHPH